MLAAGSGQWPDPMPNLPWPSNSPLLANPHSPHVPAPTCLDWSSDQSRLFRTWLHASAELHMHALHPHLFAPPPRIPVPHPTSPLLTCSPSALTHPAHRPPQTLPTSQDLFNGGCRATPLSRCPAPTYLDWFSDQSTPFRTRLNAYAALHT